MGSAAEKLIQQLTSVLEFYANSDNYWDTPLGIDKRYCKKTLQDVRQAKEENKVLQDNGELARQALDLISDYQDPVMRYIAPLCDTVIRIEEIGSEE